MSLIMWPVGLLLLFLAVVGGRVCREYEQRGEDAKSSFAAWMAMGFAVLGALVWRGA